MVEKSDRLNIQTRLPVLRAERKMTQQELADQIGVTRGTIVAIEKGNYNPTLELAFKLSRFFSTSIDALFYLQENSRE